MNATGGLRRCAPDIPGRDISAAICFNRPRRAKSAARSRRREGGCVQFHLNGFEPGDPEISDRAQRYPASGAAGSVPDEVDVLIVGCGPAGLTLAAQLAAFPD